MKNFTICAGYRSPAYQPIDELNGCEVWVISGSVCQDIAVDYSTEDGGKKWLEQVGYED